MAEKTIPTEINENLRGLLEKLRDARARADERAEVTHERFNVFTTLLEAHDEVRLHTRFLACLLDTKGSHGCHRLFLDLFFVTLKESPGLNQNSEEVSLEITDRENFWTVENEVTRDKVGRIDILLEQKAFGIAIENKIYAGEQELQIARYADYLSEKFGSNAMVIYLTCYGDPSETNDGRQYIRISYANHILNWLEKCLRETFNIIPVNQVLLQYRQVVRILTGKTTESTTMKELTDFIAHYPDLLRYREQIIDSLNEARARVLDSLAGQISQHLKPGYITSLHNNRGFGDSDGTLVIKPPPTSAVQNAPFKICIQNWTVGKTLLIGIETTKENAKTYQNIFNEMNSKLATLGYCPRGYDTWPIGWHDLIKPINDELIATIGKNSFLDTASKLYIDINNNIDAIEKAYQAAIIPH